MAVSKRLRFEVLRRDNHTCRYCGLKAPEAHLRVDHVIPVALGGDDIPENLVAACHDCNAGKSSVPADAPLVADVAQDAMRWAAAMRFAASVQQGVRAAEEQRMQAFSDLWHRYDFGHEKQYSYDRPTNWRDTIQALHESSLDQSDLEYAVEVAMRAPNVHMDNVFRYFAGVAWRIVRERQALAIDHLAAEEVDGGA